MRDLRVHGIHPKGQVFWDTPTPVLVEHALARQQGQLAHKGPLVVDTTPYTGRSPRDKFIVREPSSDADIWWGEVNQPFEPEAFDNLYERVTAHLSERDLYVQDLYAGANPKHRLAVRVITESPWHAHFARNMFILPRRFQRDDEIEPFMPEFTVVHAPSFKAVPERDGTRSEVFVLVHFAKRVVLIGGTHYGGEIKKSIFSVLNYLMPKQGVLSMHCSANLGRRGDAAIFFGLSGTGKTTLSTDPDRPLIGDDEHGWSDEGVFNFEGGCYAKVINLTPDSEPLVYQATMMFESILENVVVNPNSRRPEFDDGSKTENTRSSYPLAHLDNVVTSSMGPHPENIFFLSADAFGVLPPIARLTPEQAMYYFISGYTAKVAGTERGVTEPVATFSACFGAPFLPLHPARYAEMLRDRIQKFGPRVWMVNTGWTGGPYGVGRRMALKHTRALLSAALEGQLDDVPYVEDPVFGFQVPTTAPGVPSDLLVPKQTWPDPGAFDEAARKLARMFQENFAKYADGAGEDVRNAGPRV
ncbi:phosphoenolpyruvate carboxykinase (ATP) [Oceanithermus desulfurans]|uniref:Phosphoenolpyruvate carboxykinase (ATP) n=3 Tax=Oceanithermus TaxID=208447 RepID=A0A511RM01_9DEIN|nr:phosphoenolpyruvate carboxykinase (ATP) [Oceanithermus desulfurans]MBB6029928.1 phosphoenolpyruvate carboxykinase (ATP) [Oceanithermus desulfurans]GEM90674.1 phosphoenolpyruvate carboxykinase [ATP] [Oceanithermus desulfurans NBRC 100063]